MSQCAGLFENKSATPQAAQSNNYYRMFADEHMNNKMEKMPDDEPGNACLSGISQVIL